MRAKNPPKVNIVRTRSHKKPPKKSRGEWLREKLSGGAKPKGKKYPSLPRVAYFRDSSGNVHALGEKYAKKAEKLGWAPLTDDDVARLMAQRKLKAKDG